jgi:hypothetical protein
MRTIVRDHNKKKLELKVNRMIEQGWVQKSKIILDDDGFYHGTLTYLCVMEIYDKPNNGKNKFNTPWGQY